MIASYTVGTTEVQVLAAPASKPYSFVAVGNNGSQTAYLKLTPDPDSVTSSNGVPLPATSAIIFDQDMQKELFHGRVTAIVASGTTTISIQAF